MLESLHESKKPFKGSIFRKTSDNDFILAQNKCLRLVGAPNESLRLINRYFRFKNTFGMKTTLLESLHESKKPFKGSISAKLVIMTLF